MDVLDLTRLQFAVVTIYHYFFVPLSISLAGAAAGLHLAWLRTGKQSHRQLTELVGKLLIVTFAVGVVTGLVQEFQFGMGWSAFARFYGDVFGPTLAIEGMLAFFLEATFLALWYFGWDRLPRKLHAATIVVVAVGTVLSAFIILAANSFMQNPVAYSLDPATGRAHLDDFGALLLNKVNLAAFPHTLAGAAMAGGSLLLAIGVWRLRAAGEAAFRTLAWLGAWLTLTGGALTALTGDHLGKVITQVQPMKMAAAEALYATTTGAPFSVFALGGPDGGRPFFSLEIPWLLSVLAKGDPNATVQGIDDLQAQYAAQYGPGSYIPMIPVAFWSFRLMIGIGMLAAAVAAYYLWSTRGNRPAHRLLVRFLPLIPILPAAANTFGWVFTETARQPWLAFGISRVADGISPGLTRAEVLVSLIGFAVVYGILAAVWLRLIRHLSRQPLAVPAPLTPADEQPAEREPVPVY
ncbi:cytochrome ubiquinol oxidase subunit I [Amorphoplanes nipponensis]|uniref:Cytochrome ubiquinol oxidase subunit I n=1 Tax=Actinoplanes nipponensis TaxID=135950 RepID=A0A919MVR4_9ACTN|nr:cytochrome ubiquinol oxidase subunit I [Actinoplanes nipponensis]GIE51440.1 cytochrome ubiquinol oxidase subunit I [Actinoplanes nipponensis]